MRVPVLSGDLWIPKRMMHPDVLKDLTVALYDAATEETTIVRLYRTTPEGYHIPRQYGLDYLKQLGSEYVDSTSSGYAVNYPKPIALYDYQEPFVDDICRKAEDEYDVMAMADTGKGKTVMALEVIRRMGTTGLILVDQEFLLNQWRDRIVEFLGLDAEDVGTVRGPLCKYKGCAITIGMVQSLFNRRYEHGLYKHFGVVVFDEVHTVGAEKFSRVLMQFTAGFRLGISATPDRGDAMQKALDYNLGKVSVKLEQEHQTSHVRYVEYDGVVSFYANISPKSGRFINELSEDSDRNNLLCDILNELHARGRDVLAVSDRRAHLETVMAMCQFKGMPVEDMAIIAGYDTKWRYAKDANPISRPDFWEKGTEYTPVRIQHMTKKVPAAELEQRKDNYTILFATYGKFTKGVDVPRLSSGVDLTPRSKAKQVHGRILREQQGKLIPLWVTVRDNMSYKAEYQFSNRLTEYAKSNVEIFQWHLEKGVRKVDPAGLRSRVLKRIRILKEAKILTQRDGSNIVIT